MKNKVKKFLKPRPLNIIDLILFILILIAFNYPTKVNPWYKIREAYNLAEDASNLAEEAYDIASQNQEDLIYHEIWEH